MNSGRKYFEGVDADDFKTYEREEYKKRNDFNDTDYYKVVSFSMKLYQQAVSEKKDMLGEPFSKEELAIAANLIERMTGELAMHREAFEKDKEN
jgi:hypothetical protein